MNHEIKSPAYQLAELRSEVTRITALLAAFGSLLALLLFRGAVSLVEGHRGETWPFVLLLAATTGYEVACLWIVRKAIATGREISRMAWAVNIVLESLLPTIALFLQTHTAFVGPRRTLTSPAVLIYFLFIILSTLHLNPGLSMLSGAVSSAGYIAVWVYVLRQFPEAGDSGTLLAYASSISCAALLLLGGLAASAVAAQIRRHVIAALRDAENRAKIERFEHDFAIARSIQHGLLPAAPPHVEGFDIAGWNQPADETGGDYYDWQQMEDGRVAVTVADVTGHGIGPALCMAACRAYARAALATESDLQSFLASVNRLLCEDLPPEKFVTLAAGMLNPANCTLQLISAGHGPLIHYAPAENRFRSYDAQGPPLGIFRDFNWCTPQVLKFARGDILLLVTDGFVEWANADDEEFGLNRLKEVIRNHHASPSATIISQLHSSVVRFAGSISHADDLTAVIVKRL